MKEWPVSVIRAAAIADVSRRTIWQWLRKGVLRTERTISGHVRIYPSSLFLRRDEPPKPAPKPKRARRRELTVAERKAQHRAALDLGLKTQAANLAEARRQGDARRSVDETRAIRERRRQR